MENASKALIMAASVLLGIMLLSIGVYLFSIFGDFSSQITNALSEKEINEFNAKFYKYQSYKDSSGNWQNLCRAQDIVTIAHLAKENNAKYEYTDSDINASYYITVIVKKGISKSNNLALSATKERLGSAIKPTPNTDYHFEQDTEDKDKYTKFMKDYSLKPGTTEPIYYSCKVDINPNTKLVNKITFELPK